MRKRDNLQEIKDDFKAVFARVSQATVKELVTMIRSFMS